MSEKLEELQKALDSRPKPTDSKFAVQIDAITFHKGINKTAWEKAENEWYEDLTAKFAVFQRELEEERKCNEIKMGAMLKALEEKHRELEGKISVDKKQLIEIGEFMLLGQPAIFPYIETEFDKGYSKGYYSAKEQVQEKIRELLLVEGSKVATK